MIKRLKENEKGLTLIELLVVIVILGIIAAIAIIAIGGIIENSKKDAHIANAKQIANATKLYMAAEDELEKADITLGTLIKGGYTDAIKDPSKKDENYDPTKTTVTVVKEDNGYKYYVKLAAKDGDPVYVTPDVTGKKKDAMSLQRTDVANVNGKKTTP